MTANLWLCCCQKHLVTSGQQKLTTLLAHGVKTQNLILEGNWTQYLTLYYMQILGWSCS